MELLPAPRRTRRANLVFLFLTLLMLPDFGFTRGRATASGQVQYYACRKFPNCRFKPVREYRGPRRRIHFPICRDHNVPMDLLVVWKPRG
jgi:hypothetical protein